MRNLLSRFVMMVGLLFLSGCAEQPTQTPTAPPVEYDDAGAATTSDAPIPTAPAPRRIETH